MRKWGGIYKGLGLYWPILARQKKSVTLEYARDLTARIVAASRWSNGGRPDRELLARAPRAWGLGWESCAG